MDSFIKMAQLSPLKHATLIWQQDSKSDDGCTVDQARFSAGADEQALKAWCEGPDGYAERLKIEEAKKVEVEND
jgi:hypothetical protein